MIYILLFTTILTFTVFGIDKWKAVKKKRRISELSLLLLSFFGGSFGAIISMIVFRHKISKKSFLLKFFMVIVIQILVIVGFKYLIMTNVNDFLK